MTTFAPSTFTCAACRRFATMKRRQRALSSFFAEQVRDADAECVEADHRKGQRRLRDHVGRWRDDRGNDERQHDRPFEFLQQKCGSHDSESREEEDQNRRLEDESRRQNDHAREREEFVRLDHLLELLSGFQEESTCSGKQHAPAEPAAQNEKERRDDDERRRVASLPLVETGSNEQPKLPQDDRRGDKNPGEERHLHIEEERFREPREDELVAGGEKTGQWPRQQTKDAVRIV